MPTKAKLNKKVCDPRTLTAEVLEGALESIAQGCPHRIAVRARGFSYTQFKKVLQQGELDIDHQIDSLAGGVVKRLCEIQESKILYHLSNMLSGLPGCNGSQWILERRHWQEFSSKAETLEMAKQLEDIQTQLQEQHEQREIDKYASKKEK